MKIALVGATGALGHEILVALAEAAREPELALETPLLFATRRSAGQALPWLDDEELIVEEFFPAEMRGLDAVIVATPAAAAAKIVEGLRELGVAALDCSRTHRGNAPLFVPGTPVAGAPVVALPSPEALLLARLVRALSSHRPRWVRATVLRAASSAGMEGVSELAEGTGRLLNGQEPEVGAMPHRLAFNLVPQAGAFQGADTEAERDLALELSRLCGGALGVSATTAWGPWFYGLVVSASVGLEEALSVAQAQELFGKTEGVKVVDAPAEGIYPMPSLATGDEAVLVGRLRPDSIDPRALQLLAVMDNVRASAVLAVEALRAVGRARASH